MKAIIKKVPIPTAGVALGLAALGILLQPLSEVFHLVAGILSLFMVVMLALKIILFPRMVREDLKNPVFASVSATLFMTIMQLATYLAPFAYTPALVVWSAAIIAHFVLMIWFTIAFVVKFDLKTVFPTYFITYVGIIVASLTSPTFGMQEIGLIIFWFGFACYMVLLVVVGARYIKHEVPEPSKPLFCIFAAPMSLSLTGFLAVSPNPNAVGIAVMAVFAQLFLVLVILQMPKLLKLKFYPSYAAMTFPFVISASALLKTITYFESLGFGGALFTALHALSMIETLIAAIMVLYVFGHYLRFFFRRIEDKPTEPPLTAAEIDQFEKEIDA